MKDGMLDSVIENSPLSDVIAHTRFGKSRMLPITR